MAGIFGLMKEGEAGSETKETLLVVEANGGWIERPFMFRARRGEGEVIGRCRKPGSARPRLPVLPLGMLGSIPNVVKG